MTMQQLAITGGPQAAPGLIEYQPISGDEVAAVQRSLRETPLTTLYGGADVGRFESKFASFFGAQHAVAMTSGTSSLHAAVSALGIGPGDEVITPAYSFVASASVIVQQGATPVFCDIEPDTLNLDVAHCTKLMTLRTRAIVAVHVFGMPAEVVELRRLCDSAGIALIEDCASAPGARVGDRYVGTYGDIGCFSFNIHKIIRTGEGGMATTRDARLASALRELRVNGLNPNRGVNNVVRLGFNYTMPQFIAALGCVQMDTLEQMLTRRACNRARLHAACEHLPLRPLPDREGTTTVGYWTPLILSPELAPIRHKIVRALRAEGVFAHAGYGDPLYKIDYLRPFAADNEFPVSADIPSRVLVIDPSPWLSDEQMECVADALRKVFGRLDEVAVGPMKRHDEEDPYNVCDNSR
jgi:perosamine synthetase